jgi:hypothetical protein
MSTKQESILYGGIVVAILSTSYLGLINTLCCLGVMTGGAVSVWHFTTTQQLTIPSGDGASLGASAALVGLAISLVLNFLLMKVGLGSDTVFTNFLQSVVGDMMTAEQMDEFERQLEHQRRRSFVEYLFNAGTLLNVVIFPLFGAVGGAFGASLFKYEPESGQDNPSDSVEPG